ncbi:tetratricopeptide repeat-containing sensor histidine kinase [Chryseobacterium sp.]|uniref:tetratricopeptide repeat-containing sensor histidine kinase n=1 Tax=Chryseobacterium sp. TaxID=1871047 RepID=UPI0024E23460|nr:tetratricopeptide repeat-containing sensor histidine kinase [Chryseobacterium sp.]
MKNFIHIIFILILCSCHRKEISKTDRATYDKAYDFYDASQSDSAYTYFNKAKDELIEKGYYSFAGNSLVIMGIIQCEKGDYYGSQETALSAIKYLDEKKDSAELSANYNNLGIASQKLKDYNKAIAFFNKAATFSQDSIYKLTQLNNQAISFTLSKKFDSATITFKKVLSYPNLIKHPILYSMAYDNLAYTKFLQNKKYNAEPELLKALKIRDSVNDVSGLNATYSHLSDFFKDHNPEKSLFYAKKMLDLSSKIKIPDDKLVALQKIILLETPENTKAFFKKYQDLDDSLQIARNKSKSQFALERFGSEQLKVKNAKNEVEIFKRNIGLGALSIILVGGLFYYKRRKKRLQKENELKIKENELKLSKKVHDVVANGIYQVMTKIENQEHFDKDKALDELEFVYEKSRDISYDKADSNDKIEFNEKISVLIGSFKNDIVKTFLAGNSPNIWSDVNDSTQNEVYQVIRELLVNMKKHSQATFVAFKFERNSNLIQIQYTDNGIGISGEIIHKNGLTNTVSRIEKIKGTVIFDTKTEKGLKVYISFPTS